MGYLQAASIPGSSLFSDCASKLANESVYHLMVAFLRLSYCFWLMLHLPLVRGGMFALLLVLFIAERDSPFLV